MSNAPAYKEQDSEIPDGRNEMESGMREDRADRHEVPQTILLERKGIRLSDKIAEAI